MKINKIYISAFGGLKDFTLELNDSLNIIYGNNEDGKSTVAAFIKAMFYGTGRNSRNLADSVRLKYTPWDNSTMAGRIYFENCGKKYCLEKEFRKSDSTDRITLTDLDSGKAVQTGENIGQQFFGLSAAAFERSLFIANADFIKDDAAASEINAKLSNIALTGSEDVSYKRIEKNIFDARAKLISKNGKSGSYNEDLQALNSLNARLQKADEDAKSKTRLNNAAAQKRNEYETLYNKYIKLKALIDREQDFKNREKLIEFLETKRKLDELNRELTLSDGTLINENFAQKIEFALNRYNAAAERINQINQDIANTGAAIDLQSKISPKQAKEKIVSLNSEIKKLNQEKSDLENKELSLNEKIKCAEQKLLEQQNKKKAFNPIFLILGIIFAVISGAFSFITSIVGIVAGAVASITLLVLAFVIKPKCTSGISAAQNELAALTTRLTDIKSQKNIIYEKINTITAETNTLSAVLQADSAVKQQLGQKTELLKAEQQKANSAKAELFASVCSFGNIDNIEDIKEILNRLKQKTEQQKEIKLQLKTASQFLGNIDYDEAKTKLEALKKGNDRESIDFNAVKSEFESVTERLSSLKEDLTVIATELKAAFKNSENPEDIKREISVIQERADSKKAFCDAADLAISVLEESFYELRRSYGSELEALTHSIFSELTDGKYKSVNITDSLDLSVEKSDVFGTRELDYLSIGTSHQAYLSLRLAITELISSDNPLPVFLDDALSQYDDIRTKRAISYLNRFCKNRQGILFTCHNSICEIAKSQNIPILKPYK